MAAWQGEGSIHLLAAIAALLMAEIHARVVAGLVQPVTRLRALDQHVLCILHMAAPAKRGKGKTAVKHAKQGERGQTAMTHRPEIKYVTGGILDMS